LTTHYCFGKTVSLDFDTAVQRATEELAKQGFGVFTAAHRASPAVRLEELVVIAG
jgi:uncharacterized protein (DUF302 family)